MFGQFRAELFDFLSQFLDAARVVDEFEVPGTCLGRPLDHGVHIGSIFARQRVERCAPLLDSSELSWPVGVEALLVARELGRDVGDHVADFPQALGLFGQRRVLAVNCFERALSGIQE